MAGGVGALTVSLGLDAADYVNGLNKADQLAKSASNNISNNFAVAARGASIAFTAMATAGAAAFAAINSQANNIANLQDIAENIGDTASAVSSLQTAADLSGTALDEVAGASIKLTSALSKTDDESKGAGAAIKALGLDFQEFKNLSPVEQIDAVSKAMAGFEDGASKTAVAVALFGKSGASLIPFLNDLAEEGERQIRLTDEQVQQADDYIKAQARIKTQLDQTTQTLAAGAIPALADFLEIVGRVIKGISNSEAAVLIFRTALGAVGEVFKTIATGGALLSYTFTALGTSIAFAGAAAVALATGNFRTIPDMFKAFQADAQKARGDLEEFLTALENTPKVSQVKATVTGETDAPKKALEFAANQEKAKKAVIETNDAAVNLANTYAGLLQSAQDLARPDGETAADRLEKELNAITNLDAGTRAYIETIIAQKRASDALKESEEERRQIIAENVRKQIEDLKQAEEDRHQSIKDQALEQKAILEGQKDKYADLTRAVDGFAKNAASSLADFAFGGKTSFSDMVNSFLKDLARLALQKSIFDPIAKQFDGFGSGNNGNTSFGGFGGIFGSLFSGLGFANGGVPPINKASLVGERGPELFVPKVAGTVIPNSKMGGQENNISITINSDGSRNQQGNPTELARQIEAAVVKVMINQKRQGGALA
jgi:hypothetical protein